ncbi:unnamed protein product [Amoebophrya sp. A120]|nr:unnamed protein product [Amoebophrya sp. A120]|eukprot:GSA120T00016435001.1
MRGRRGAVALTSATLLVTVPSSSATASSLTPIQKVVGLLQQMATNLEEEKSKDKELYSNLQCWCKTNTKDFTKKIADGKAAAKSLEAEIFEHAGKLGEYKTNAKNAEKKVAKLEGALQDAEEQYEAAMKDMRDEEAETVSTISALENALQILGKHQGLLETRPEVVNALQTVMYMSREKGKIYSHAEKPLQKSFLQANTGTGASMKLARALEADFRPSLDEQSAAQILQTVLLQTKSAKAEHLGKYQSGSGQIFGILNSMKDEFSADLKELEEKIATEEKAYKELKKSTTEQLEAARKSFEENTALAGKAKFLGTEGKEELKKIRAQVDADTTVLLEVKDQCTNIDIDWKLRTEARDAEIAAVAKAIEIMTSDETRGALQPSEFGLFVQTQAQSSLSRSKKLAQKVLQHTLDSLPSWNEVNLDLQNAKLQNQMQTQKQKLALIAESVRLDAFEKVKKMIDELVADIKEQMALDVKTKDECGANIKKNEKESTEAKRALQLAEEKIAALVEDIAKIDADVVAEKESIAETKKDMTKAEQDREAENAEFQKTVTEQREMQKVLSKALKVLKDHYEKASLLQLKASAKSLSHHKQTPMPGSLSGYKKQDASTGVLAMMDKIMTDSKDLEKEALVTESSAQKDYEKYIADSVAALEASYGTVASLEEERADKVQEKADTEKAVENTKAEIEGLSKVNTALHNDCDFLLKFFTARQEAMASEVEAAQKAKAILSGAK